MIEVFTSLETILHLMVCKCGSIDEVHAFLKARPMITLVCDLLQEHPGMYHFVQQRLLELKVGSKL